MSGHLPRSDRDAGAGGSGQAGGSSVVNAWTHLLGTGDDVRAAVSEPPSPDTRLVDPPPPPPGTPPGRGVSGQPPDGSGSLGPPAAGTTAPRRQGAREQAQRRAEQRRQPRQPRTPDAPPAEELRTVPSAAHRLRRALHNDRAVRQAVLLREILGPPVALRPPSDAPPGLR